MTHPTPAASTATQAGPAAQVTLDLLDELFAGFDRPDFAVRLWNGASWGRNPTGAATTLLLPHPGSLRQLLSKPTEAHMAECYMHGAVDVEGDLEGIIPVGEWLLERQWGVRERLHLGYQLMKLPAWEGEAGGGNGRRPAHLRGTPHSLKRDRRAVTYHYDVSNRFYSLWLDRNMVYSCALFATPDRDLDAAQEHKLDYICRKLRLQAGERLLDIGCGWGALIEFAARHYGVEALGVTLSRPQADLANERLGAAGLLGRCRVEVSDYRELDGDAAFDKLVSIGMVEHVGRERLAEYFAKAWRLLRPGGTFLNHGIADLPSRPAKAKDSFIDTYIFPDGDLPPIPRILGAAEDTGFETRDVENLREHYTLTLRHWVKRLEARRDKAVAEVGETVYRTWRLYLSGCTHWFERGSIGVYQTLLVKPDGGRSGLPLMRSDWYEAATGSS